MKLRLSNINNELRYVIQHHLKNTGKSLNEFCKDAGVQQNQMWMFLNRVDPNVVCTQKQFKNWANTLKIRF